MPFIPHTVDEIEAMLKVIGVNTIETLFDEIPKSLRNVSLEHIPLGIPEIELTRLIQKRAKQDGEFLCFIGAGAYDHFIPPTVWEIATRGEFMTAYTPYQAEASQGNLQLIYEFQTMIASLTGLEAANASLYDGSTALAEAILMAVRLSKKRGQRNILFPRNIHPLYRNTVHAIVRQQNIKLIDIPYNNANGLIDFDELNKSYDESIAALVIPQPNFFGMIEDVDALTLWAAQKGIVSIGLVNPLAMFLLKPPGQWGAEGVDIACGEGQPLGIPLSSGGPYYGFLSCKKMHIRQMPGRIVGRTVDKNGKMGFVLTLQAREQHIRRAKATSNICTNQGLMVTASTIYMSLLGPSGLKNVALANHKQTRLLSEKLSQVEGVQILYKGPFFNEIVLKCDYPVANILSGLAKKGIQGGFPLSEYYQELSDCLLICATEMRNDEDIHFYVESLKDVLHKEKQSFLISANGGQSVTSNF